MLYANLSPASPRTKQYHDLIQQALKAAGVCKIPNERAREEEKEKELSCNGYRASARWVNCWAC